MTLLGAIIVGGSFLLVAQGIGEWVVGALSWWAVGLGDLLAVGMMAPWIWRTHPGFRVQYRAWEVASRT